jgi:hypothetical protein
MSNEQPMVNHYKPVLNNNVPIPFLAKVLGYSGLIPFVFLAAALWSFNQDSLAMLHQALLSYAAIILSFMGAVHWGLAIGAAQLRTTQLGFSVFPPLIAWFASFAPQSWNYSLLILTFILLCVFDIIMFKQNAVPKWYPRLRIPLSVIVILSLIAGQLKL